MMEEVKKELSSFERFMDNIISIKKIIEDQNIEALEALKAIKAIIENTDIKSIIEDSVILASEEFESLYDDSLMLTALKAAGVDNWEFYDCAQDILEEWAEEEEEEEDE
jgi:hypothetical protein